MHAKYGNVDLKRGRIVYICQLEYIREPLERFPDDAIRRTKKKNVRLSMLPTSRRKHYPSLHTRSQASLTPPPPPSERSCFRYVFGLMCTNTHGPQGLERGNRRGRDNIGRIVRVFYGVLSVRLEEKVSLAEKREGERDYLIGYRRRKTKSGVGEECVYSHCTEGTRCDGKSGMCLSVEGNRCRDSADCARGLVCSGVCQVPRKTKEDELGGPCPCSEKDNSCSNSKSNPDIYMCLGREGAKCERDHQCVSQLCYDNICRDSMPSGFTCSDNSKCESKNCSRGICQNPGITTGTLGARCNLLVKNPNDQCRALLYVNLVCAPISSDIMGVCSRPSRGLHATCGSGDSQACYEKLDCVNPDHQYETCSGSQGGHCSCNHRYLFTRIPNLEGLCPSGTEHSPNKSRCLSSAGYACKTSSDCARGTCGNNPVLYLVEGSSEGSHYVRNSIHTQLPRANVRDYQRPPCSETPGNTHHLFYQKDNVRIYFDALDSSGKKSWSVADGNSMLPGGTLFGCFHNARGEILVVLYHGFDGGVCIYCHYAADACDLRAATRVYEESIVDCERLVYAVITYDRDIALSYMVDGECCTEIVTSPSYSPPGSALRAPSPLGVPVSAVNCSLPYETCKQYKFLIVNDPSQYSVEHLESNNKDVVVTFYLCSDGQVRTYFDDGDVWVYPGNQLRAGTRCLSLMRGETNKAPATLCPS